MLGKVVVDNHVKKYMSLYTKTSEKVNQVMAKMQK